MLRQQTWVTKTDLEPTYNNNNNNNNNNNIENGKIEKLKKKPMHGQFYRDLERSTVDKEKSLACLCRSGLKGEMESLTIATLIKHSIRVIIRGTS
jgi:hypothetical protein